MVTKTDQSGFRLADMHKARSPIPEVASGSSCASPHSTPHTSYQVPSAFVKGGDFAVDSPLSPGGKEKLEKQASELLAQVEPVEPTDPFSPSFMFSELPAWLPKEGLPRDRRKSYGTSTARSKRGSPGKELPLHDRRRASPSMLDLKTYESLAVGASTAPEPPKVSFFPTSTGPKVKVLAGVGSFSVHTQERTFGLPVILPDARQTPKTKDKKEPKKVQIMVMEHEGSGGPLAVAVVKASTVTVPTAAARSGISPWETDVGSVIDRVSVDGQTETSASPSHPITPPAPADPQNSPRSTTPSLLAELPYASLISGKDISNACSPNIVPVVVNSDRCPSDDEGGDGPELPAAGSPRYYMQPKVPTDIHFYITKTGDIGSRHIKPPSQAPVHIPRKKKNLNQGIYSTIRGDPTKSKGLRHVPIQSKDHFTLEGTMLSRLALRVKRGETPTECPILTFGENHLMTEADMQSLLEWNETVYDQLLESMDSVHDPYPEAPARRAVTPGLPVAPSQTSIRSSSPNPNATSFRDQGTQLVVPAPSDVTLDTLMITHRSGPSTPNLSKKKYNISYQDLAQSLQQRAVSDAQFNSFSRCQSMDAFGHLTFNTSIDPDPYPLSCPPTMTESFYEIPTHEARPIHNAHGPPFIKGGVGKLGPSRLRHPPVAQEKKATLRATSQPLFARGSKKYNRPVGNSTPHEQIDVNTWMSDGRPIRSRADRDKERLLTEMHTCKMRLDGVLHELPQLPW